MILLNGWKSHNDNINKPGTAKVGAVSKAQNCKKGDPLGFVKLQLVAKYEKKLKGDPWEIFKNFQKNLKLRFLNSVTVPKNVKGGPFGIFWHPLRYKISKQTKGRPFGGIRKKV